jgi:hypothetical protein
MFPSDPRDALMVAHERVRRLREERAAEGLRNAAGTRRALAASLRRAANRLDPPALAARPA